MNSFMPCIDILPSSQQALWEQLRPCSALHFVLYGGTAIALQLGHRTSVDFDFFSHLPLNAVVERDLLSHMPFLNRAKLLQSDINTRCYCTDSGVQVSFFGGIDVGRVGDPLVTQDGVLQVASLDDLLAMKLKVVLQRVEAKDYIDIAALLRHGMSLEKGLAGAQTLYGTQFSPLDSIKAMTYFHGGDLDRLSTVDRKTLLDAVRQNQFYVLPKLSLLSRELVAPVDESPPDSPSKQKKQKRMR